MKKILFLTMLIISVGSIVQAQDLNPVNWTFTSKKINDKTYKVYMTANIQAGWHVYAQTQPDDAIAIPTSFVINSNPLLTLNGKVKEEGKLEKFKDEKLEISANQYSNKVNFVQVVKLLGSATAKTNVSGTVEFQTCNDEKCLSPKKVNFSVQLE